MRRRSEFSLFVILIALIPRTLGAAEGGVSKGPNLMRAIQDLELPAPDLQIEASAPPSPFGVNLALDGPIIALGLLSNLLPMALSPKDPAQLDLRPEGVNGFDRNVIGHRSQTADTLSDIFLGTSMALPFVASLIDVMANKPSDGFLGLGKDYVVLLETYAINALVCNVVKSTVRRPRPYMYDPMTPEEDRRDVNGTMSFFSGHTSTAFSMATSYSYLFTLRHPDSPYVIPIWLGTHALASATGLMRVYAGKHFWSDVLVGAAVGSAIGLLVPMLHRTKERHAGKSKILDDLSVAPTTYQGSGMGVNLSFTW